MYTRKHKCIERSTNQWNFVNNSNVLETFTTPKWIEVFSKAHGAKLLFQSYFQSILITISIFSASLFAISLYLSRWFVHSTRSSIEHEKHYTNSKIWMFSTWKNNLARLSRKGSSIDMVELRSTSSSIFDWNFHIFGPIAWQRRIHTYSIWPMEDM